MLQRVVLARRGGGMMIRAPRRAELGYRQRLVLARASASGDAAAPAVASVGKAAVQVPFAIATIMIIFLLTEPHKRAAVPYPTAAPHGVALL